MSACVAVTALALGLPGASQPCLDLDLRLAGRLGFTWPATGPSPEISLPWARVGLGLREGERLAARLAVEGSRTGGSAGSIGVDGESIVARLLLAELQVAASNAGLRGAIGLIEDPWVASGERAWGLRGVAPSLGADQGWWEPADLGAQLGWRSSAWSALLSATSGEGYRYRERDDAKDVSLLLRGAPLALGDEARAEDLRLEVFGALGTQGLDSAPTRRLGARVSGGAALIRGGIELDLARGVDGDPERAPRGASAWAVLHPAPALAFARADLIEELSGEPESRALTLRAGGGLSVGQEAALVVGVEHRRFGPQAGAVAGAGALDDETTAYVQLHGRFDAVISPAAR